MPRRTFLDSSNLTACFDFMKTISKIISLVLFPISIPLFLVSCQNEKNEDTKPEEPLSNKVSGMAVNMNGKEVGKEIGCISKLRLLMLLEAMVLPEVIVKR